jgi:hypothetical protein
LADEYHIRVKMKAGPFAMEDDAESIIQATELRADPNDKQE